MMRAEDIALERQCFSRQETYAVLLMPDAELEPANRRQSSGLPLALCQ